MRFILRYLRNLALLTLVIAGAVYFVKLISPSTLPIFSTVIKAYRGLDLWPIVIIFVMLVALPRRER
jgi:hypothetical protein